MSLKLVNQLRGDHVLNLSQW